MTGTSNESEMLEVRRVHLRIPHWFPIASFVAALAVYAVFPGAAWSFAVYIASVVAAFASLFLTFRLPPREQLVRIQVSREGVRAGARMLIRRSAVRNATIAEIAGGGAVLTFRGAWRSVTFRMASAEEAATVMAKLQILPASRAMVFARGIQWWVTPLMMFVGALGAILAHRIIHPIYLSAILSIAALAISRWNGITIGREGIRISSLVSSRFVAYGDIEEVVDEARAIVLRLKGGKILRVASQGIWTPYTRESGNRHLVHHILLAQRALEQLGRSPQAVTAMTMATGATLHIPQYRVPAVPREDLLATAEDPSADVKLRIAAVHALASDADSDERARLETIAEASASPLLRMAVKRTE